MGADRGRPPDAPGEIITDDRAALIAEHGPSLWGLCRRLCPEPEDAYQEIWEKALGALDRFDPHGTASLRSWLLTIAHRHLVDRHRRRTVRGVVVPLAGLSTPAEAEEVLDRAQRHARLEAALARLPEPQRRVVVLHHLHGCTLEQLAESEEVALGTIKSRLHRGRARLAELLDARPAARPHRRRHR